MVGSSDIGTAIIYAVVSMGLLALCYYAGTSRYSVDFYIEKRISWWWKVAEVGRPAPIAPTASTVIPMADPPADLGSVDLANAKPYAARDAMNHGAMTSSPALPCRVRFRSGVWRHQWSPVLARNVKGRGQAAGRSTPTNQMMGAMDQQPRHPTNERVTP